jgi:hypothetical protein
MASIHTGLQRRRRSSASLRWVAAKVGVEVHRKRERDRVLEALSRSLREGAAPET